LTDEGAGRNARPPGQATKRKKESHHGRSPGSQAARPLSIWASELIYPVRCAARDALSTIERRCPDCEHRDWHRRNGHVAMRLSAFPASLGFGDRLALNQAKVFRPSPAPNPAPDGRRRRSLRDFAPRNDALGWMPAQLFVAPPTSPRRSARCETMNTMATGKAAISVASASAGRDPLKRSESPTWIGSFLSSDRNT
jgi:hypothetical protein